MQRIVKNYLVKIILVFTIAVTLSEAYVTEIDTLAHLQAVGGGTCTYFQDYSDVTCKEPWAPIVNKDGFWSSCTESNCELKIELRRLFGDDKILTRLEVLSYVDGLTSQINVRYKVTPDSPSRNLQVIEDTMGWTTIGIDIDSSLELTADSEIYLRLSSGPFVDAIDLLDKIRFTYIDIPSTSTPDPITTYPTPEPTTKTTTETGTHPTTESATEPSCVQKRVPIRPRVDFDCPEAEGLYADPINCRGFYNCVDWYPYHFCCPLPLFYNSAAQKCDFRDMVECHNDPGLPCDSLTGMINFKF